MLAKLWKKNILSVDSHLTQFFAIDGDFCFTLRLWNISVE